jgi:hypothetical protein
MVVISGKLGEVLSLDTAGQLVTLVPGSFTSAGVSVRELHPLTGVALVRRSVSWDELKCITAVFSLPLSDVSVLR